MIPTPSDNVLIVLASLVVHAEEGMSSGGHDFDQLAMQSCVENPEVQEWLEKIDPVLLPQKRT